MAAGCCMALAGLVFLWNFQGKKLIMKVVPDPMVVIRTPVRGRLHEHTDVERRPLTHKRSWVGLGQLSMIPNVGMFGTMVVFVDDARVHGFLTSWPMVSCFSVVVCCAV